MKLWQIAWKSIEHRRLASILTAFSMSLGVALIVTVIVIYGVLSDSFNRSAQGYDLVVGPKGSPLELVMATMFYVQNDTLETIPYDYYWQLSVGRYATEIEAAVPIALGDYYKGVPVIGTIPEFFSKFEYRERRSYEFDGTNLDAGDDYCAVVGYTAARKLKLKLGDEFLPDAVERLKRGEQDVKRFKIVGILKPTYTPNDSAIFVHLPGFFEAYAYEKAGMAHILGSVKEDKGIVGNEMKEGEEKASDTSPYAKRRITAVLVLTKEKATAIKAKEGLFGGVEGLEMDSRLNRPVASAEVMALAARIGGDLDAQAIRPIDQIAILLDKIVGNMQLVLIILAVLVVVVAGIGMMVSIYNSMNERRQEIAIMRALGARRTTVMGIILLESILLSLGGGLFGVLIGHLLIAVIGPFISEAVNIIVSPWRFQLAELVLVPGLVLLASIVGYLPAVVAYRTDVAQSLQS